MDQHTHQIVNILEVSAPLQCHFNHAATCIVQWAKKLRGATISKGQKWPWVKKITASGQVLLKGFRFRENIHSDNLETFQSGGHELACHLCLANFAHSTNFETCHETIG